MAASPELTSPAIAAEATAGVYTKLSPGPGRRADEVAAHQRTRFHAAMIELVAERGCADVAVHDLAERAKVSSDGGPVARGRARKAELLFAAMLADRLRRIRTASLTNSWSGPWLYGSAPPRHSQPRSQAHRASRQAGGRGPQRRTATSAWPPSRRLPSHRIRPLIRRHHRRRPDPGQSPGERSGLSRAEACYGEDV